MSHSQLLLCLFSISAAFFNSVEAILGGNAAIEGQFPYQISLERGGESVCGGSILSEHFVMTAAHCVLGEENSFENVPLKVVAGITDLKSRSNSRVAVDVVEVFLPEEYDVGADGRYSFSTGDIAILKLTKDLDLEGNSNLGKVQLPEKGKTYEGKNATVSGFGLNYIEVATNEEGEYYGHDGKAYDKMRFAEANVLSYGDCHGIFTPVRTIKKSHICAAIVQRDEEVSEGVCYGDSGGPLVYKDVQIGVVSTATVGCGEEYQPAVYTRVTEYLDFIHKVVEGKIDNGIRTTTLRILPERWE